MTPVLVLGWLAAAVGSLLGVPQAVRLARSRDVEGLSLPAWQAILGLNLAWTSHGILIGQANMIVPNILALATTFPILVLMSREMDRAITGVLLPGFLLGAVMIVIDLTLGTAAFGMVALWPALFSNAGQTLELVRSPRVVGVSPLFLAGAVLNQVLWLAWGVLVDDAGTKITATTTLAITTVNLLWWSLRRLGLRSFGVPTRDELRARVRAGR